MGNVRKHNRHPPDAQVSYMLDEDYLWATADWLGPEAGHPTEAAC